MARISPRLVKDAYAISPLLPYFLRANRTLALAKQELKWVQNELPPVRWQRAARLRHNLYPLQYILGSQPFGPLDIKCKENVLIPRPETEEWVLKLCKAVKGINTLNVVDACTGSGCIALLAKHQLQETAHVTAFDISDDAVELASWNAKANNLDVDILRADLADPTDLVSQMSQCDLLLSNPPYIPAKDYNLPVKLNGIEKSVRKFEPRLALVGDMEFYNLLVQKLVLPFGAKGFVFELGYIEQAQFVRDQLKADEWECGVMRDYSGNVRCSIGWKRGSKLQVLEEICDEILA